MHGRVEGWKEGNGKGGGKVGGIKEEIEMSD